MFNLGKKKKSKGLKSGVQGDWWAAESFLLAKNSLIGVAVWQISILRKVFHTDLRHPLFIGQIRWTVVFQIQLFPNHYDHQPTIGIYRNPDSLAIFISFYSWKPAWFTFNRVFLECLKPPENLGPWQITVSIGLFKFGKCFHLTVPKSETKFDSALFEIVFRYFHNVLEKTGSQKQYGSPND